MPQKVKKKIRCIACPEGCKIDVLYNLSKSAIESMEGHRCKRGIKFTEQEIKNPVRILTTTISIRSNKKNRLPVRSSAPAPKEKIRQMVLEAKKIKVVPPISMGDILARNFLDTGVDLIASETLNE